MQTTTYTLRVNPDGSSFYSYAVIDATDVDFGTALEAARAQSKVDSWKIVRGSDGIAVALYDSTGIDAWLWRNYRRDELAANAAQPLNPDFTPEGKAEQLYHEALAGNRASMKVLFDRIASALWDEQKWALAGLDTLIPSLDSAFVELALSRIRMASANSPTHTELALLNDLAARLVLRKSALEAVQS